MALSDLQVFQEQTYSVATEILDQKIELFNAASGGTIVLETSAQSGDFSDTSFFKKVDGMVKRRNAYGSGSLSAKKLENLVDTVVKIGAGIYPIEINPGQFAWIQKDPSMAAAVIGQQLAADMMADMLNTSIGAGYAALSGVAGVIFDGTAGILNARSLVKGAAKFGDRSSAIKAWICHSKPLADFYVDNLTNVENLFKYETISVLGDPFGRLFIQTDCPALVTADGVSVGVDEYHTLGLVTGGINVGKNTDFTDNIETKNGDENILRTYQAEWSYNLGIKGFSWDKTNGSKSPNDATVLTATNWDKTASSIKDLAGVIVETK